LFISYEIRPLKEPDINNISEIAFFIREGEAPAEPHLYRDLTSFVTAQQELRPPPSLNYLSFSKVSLFISYEIISVPGA
jgi:hypothetical protein